MKHIKLFEAFSTSTSLTEDQIKWLDRCAKGRWKMNPSTGLIDVDGGFYCPGQGLTDFKGVAFGHISGSSGTFYCDNNLLTSLEGAPQTVNGDFYCDNNQITSLKGAPQKVGGGFYCTNNPVPEETLVSIFALMKKGKSYQQALEECWPNMNNEDRALMYKDLKGLTPEEIRMYQSLATVSRIKNYL